MGVLCFCLGGLLVWTVSAPRPLSRILRLLAGLKIST
jgi:hypothetical protein